MTIEFKINFQNFYHHFFYITLLEIEDFENVRPGFISGKCLRLCVYRRNGIL